MEISNIVNQLLIRYPLFGHIIVSLEFKLINSSVPAPAYTDGTTIFYKQEFLDNYTTDEKEFIIAHELFHVVLSHLSRNVGKDRDLLNYVEDAIINQLLVHDGLCMPEGLVDVPDALDYSVDELYMRFLPRLEEIKAWMNANTFHLEIQSVGDSLEKMYKKDLQDLMAENSELKNDFVEDYKENLKKQAQAGKEALGLTFPAVSVGKSAPLLTWRDVLKASLITSSETITSFYETEMDGMLRKEEKPDCSEFESEIIIDSSGSMDMQTIKVILRECKNILELGHIKVGFCDTEFYGWHDIDNEMDIDNLNISGRGGTDFEVMNNSFSKDAINKIIITDGYAEFPEYSDALWIIIGWYGLPSTLNKEYNPNASNINYIYIDYKDIDKPKSLVLKR